LSVEARSFRSKGDSLGPLTLVPLYGVALLLQRQAGLKPSTAFLHAVASIVLVLYAAGLAGLLWWAALAVHVGGTGLLAVELLRRVRGMRTGFVVPTPYVVLAVLAAVFFAFHRNDLYFYYDEYAHWGIFVKEMLAFDSFWPADTNAMHPRYPPAAPLWQYLFNVFLLPREGFTYFGQFVLLFAPLLVLWEAIPWRHAMWSVGVLALCVLVLANFGLGVTSLYVDHVLGVWFAGTVFSFVLERSTSWPRALSFAAPVAVIALLKDAGLPFALAAAAIMAALYCRRIWPASVAYARFARPAAVFVGLIVPAWICVQGWSWNRDYVGSAEDVQSVDGIVSGLVSSAGDDDPISTEISRRFVDVFLNQQLSNDAVSSQFNAFSYGIRDLFTDRFRLTTATMLLAVVAWWIVLAVFVLTREARWTFGIVACGFLAAAVGYIVILYFSYRFAFGDRGLELSSYIRYVHTVVLPLALCAFAPLLPAFREPGTPTAWVIGGRRVPRHAALFGAALVALYVAEPPHLLPLVRPNDRHQLREVFEPVTRALQAGVGRARVWIYLPQDQPNGFIGRMLQYLLTPTPVLVERSEDFMRQSEHEIRDRWSGVDYVWIPMQLPEAIAADWARLAGGGPPAGLFHVRSSANGELEVELVTWSQLAPQ
jgi:hypothetical protein